MRRQSRHEWQDKDFRQVVGQSQGSGRPLALSFLHYGCAQSVICEAEGVCALLAITKLVIAVNDLCFYSSCAISKGLLTQCYKTSRPEPWDFVEMTAELAME